MEKQRVDTCENWQGILPSCAPLAVPYVPFQRAGTKKYAASDALDNGTLFPALNLPFHLKVDAANVVSCPLTELQALSFVVQELGLYLDTHPDDAEAFGLYQKYAALEQEAKTAFTAEQGPLFQTDMVCSKTFDWTQDPWPWNYSKGGK